MQGLYDPSYEHDSCGVGLVAHIKGRRSHQIIRDAGAVLVNMQHRSACGCEPDSGDGAGILTALPHEFLAKAATRDMQVDLPPVGRWGAGVVFLPQLAAERRQCKEAVNHIVQQHGQRLLGWRRVPVDPVGAGLGATARSAEPVIQQLFVAAAPGMKPDAFERILYLIRKRASHLLRVEQPLRQGKFFYICSLSTQQLIYKGMLRPVQLMDYFADLRDRHYATHYAIVHSRFSTNTFPSWDRAQPNRMMCHNGEINTLKGNVNWMRARQGVAHSPLFGDHLRHLFPIAEPDCSDSGNFDNVLEFLRMSGRSLPEAVMMMIPEAWQENRLMADDRRAFYEYHSCLMEPWDGPASIIFSDGGYAGAVLDRNGLRPSRYTLTHDDRVILASEVGVLPTIPPNLIKAKGRLQPGRMFLIDFRQGRVVPDREVKTSLARQRPYRFWLDRHGFDLKDLTGPRPTASLDSPTLIARQRAFGYTTETLQFMLLPLVEQRRDPVGSMGNDAALACLSQQPRLIYDYFKQLFAQVTNPAIDSIREQLVMSLECWIGPEGNLLETTEEQASRLRVSHPVLTNQELAAIQAMDQGGWRTKTIDMTFDRRKGSRGLRPALLRICQEAEDAVNDYGLLVLSDRAVSPRRVQVSSLLACGAVHQHLVRRGKRTRVGIVVETGEAREVHHHCLLVGFGADAINPYLAFESLWEARRQGWLAPPEFNDDAQVVKAYRKGVAKGMLKVMAKMGISTLQSYKGAQIFEALGLGDEVIDFCFAGTSSQIQGVDFELLARELLRLHRLGYPKRGDADASLPNPGEYHWRPGGEKRAWDPATIASLQVAARGRDSDSYEEFARRVNDENRDRHTLRGLMGFRSRSNGVSVDLTEVEPASEIVKRFCTGAMSFGSISTETHETLAIAMNRIGGKSNTGEGGEDPARFQPLPNGDSRRSAIKQVASGRFGVTAWYLTNADELQIKIAQGAKPGEGGELPSHKVDQTIARIRYSTPGVGLISPPPHHDIYSIEDLAQLIYDLKNANPSARVSVKLVSEIGVGTIAAGVAKAHADQILISGDSGGTGASPLTSIKNAGLPWELGLAETHQTLVLNDLRSRVVLQTDGGIKTGRDVVIAGLLGAEEIGFSTAPLISLGCIMMRKCHLNTCPVGIATQDPVLRRRFSGKPEHVINYLFLVAEETRTLMARLGFRRFKEMIGRVDVIDAEDVIGHWKAEGLNLTRILAPAQKPHDRVAVTCQIEQDHGLRYSLDNRRLIRQCRPALLRRQPVRLRTPIANTDRTVGTTLSHQVVRTWGEQGLPEDTIRIKFHGAAGQSFGAWLADGVTLELEGEANDYVGKGLSGGKLILYPPAGSGFQAQDQIIAGNVVLYGATSGRAFFRGQVAERFCVRNSGAWAVVEGVGDHGCEYMTGGRVVILGPTGRNFAAGMSGGIAYVWDRSGDFRSRCHLGMVDLEPLVAADDIVPLRELIRQHQLLTGSPVAAALLQNWSQSLSQFVKVMPKDYKRALARLRESAATDSATNPRFWSREAGTGMDAGPLN